MAVKQIGGHLIREYEDRVDLFADSTQVAKINVDAQAAAVKRQTEVVGKVSMVPDTMLGIIPVMPFIPPIEYDLNVGTIVPVMDARIDVASFAVESMSEFIPDSVFSPAPASIFGAGTAIGTIMVYLGKRLIVEIAAEIGFEGLQRIGQRAVAGARIRGRTASNPENVGRHVQVVADNQRSGFLPNRKHYDQPCKFWEVWCWIV